MVFFSNRQLSSGQLTSAQNYAGLNLTSDPASRSTSFLAKRQRASDQGGNTLTTATSIPTPGKKRIVDTVSRGDTDLFKFVITNTSNISLKVKNRSEVTLIGSILDSQGQIVSYDSTSQSGTIAPDRRIKNFYRDIQPGTYYVRMATRSRAAGEYELKLNVIDPTVPEDCGCGT